MISLPSFRIGTRGSPLAQAQARELKSLLTSAFPELVDQVVITVIKTTGDIVQDRALSEIGGKGLFTKEIDDAMLDGRIDVAVHSMKDVPTWLPDGIVLPCMLKREDTRDVFISKKAKSIADLPKGSVIGTASLRRQALVLHQRPDLKVVTFRGNVATRLKKLAAGDVDATLLAMAGLNRLGRADVITSVIEPEEILPAVAQGAIGITCRVDDEVSQQYLAALNHDETVIRITAERALLKVLDGSCRTPIAALGEIISDGTFFFRGLAIRPDGSELLETKRSGSLQEAEALGRDAGEELKARASPDFFDAMELS
jgi:hydroxymethylbilane synthase